MHFTMTQIINYFNLTSKLTNFSSVMSFIYKLSRNEWFLYETNTDLNRLNVHVMSMYL